MKTALFSTIAVLTVSIAGLLGPSNIDPANRFGWTENLGWLNWQHDAPNPGDGVSVSATFLAGFVWAENVGWINLGNGGPYENDPFDSSTFGVNVDPGTGELYGKAWGQNIGWINFDTRATQGPHNQQARLDFCGNRFRGYAWGENIGWINLDHAMHFIALGPDCQAGDVACDGVIGLGDYAMFYETMAGPGITADCPLFDINGDDDVDLDDFAEVQVAFTGDGIIPIGNGVYWSPPSGGSWHDSGNWNAGVAPGDGDVVFIDVPGTDVTVTYSTGTTNLQRLQCEDSLAVIGGTLNIDQRSRINGGLALHSTFGGAGDQTIRGALNWTAGTLAGSGITNVDGSATFNSLFGVTLSGRTLNLLGTTNWIDGPVQITAGGVLNNHGLLDLSGTNGEALTGTGQVVNVGTFLKSGPAGTESRIRTPFSNQGTVEVQAGTLSFYGNGTHSGDFDVSDGATLRISGGTHVFAKTLNVSGPGRMHFHGGTTNVLGSYTAGGHTEIGGNGTLNFRSACSVVFNGLTLAGTLGGIAEHTITGPFDWLGGTLTGSGITNVEGSSTFDILFTATLSERTLNLFGTTDMISGSVQIIGGGALNNHGLLDLSAANGEAFPGTGQITNFGTFLKSGPAGTESRVRAPFSNHGTVDVQVGTLSFYGNGTHTGDFNVSDGATLRISGGMHVFDTTSTVSGLGRVHFQGGTTDVLGSYTAGGLTEIVNTGTVNFNSADPVVFDRLTLGATLGGIADQTITGPFDWLGGTLTGSGITNVEGSSTFDILFTATLSERSLNLFGATDMVSGSVQIIDGGALNNHGLLDLSAANGEAFPGTGQITNFGTFLKSGPAGTESRVRAPFSNEGFVDVEVGTLSFYGNGTHTGDFDVRDGATLRISGGTHVFDTTSTVGGLGRVHFQGGSSDVLGSFTVSGLTEVGGGGTVNFNSTDPVVFDRVRLEGTLGGIAEQTIVGPLNWTSGTLTGPGITNVDGNATFNSLFGVTLNDRTMNLFGTTNLVRGGMSITGGGALNNHGLFDISMTGDTISGTGHIVNFGTFSKSGPAGGHSNVRTFFSNEGLVEALGGTLWFRGGYIQTDGATVVAGGIVRSDTTMSIQGGAIGGAGIIDATVHNSGLVEPGDGPDILNLGGGFRQFSSGMLIIELGGLISGDEYDVLAITDTAAFDGTLEISLIDGFTPQLGDTFVIITYASHTGTFATINAPALGGGLLFEPIYGSRNLTLVVR